MTVGEETELYYWNGTEWLPKILKVDTSKIEKIVNDAQASTNQAIAQANAKAEEALKKAGTLPDTSRLSDQIKQQILSSPDLQNKVTEEVRNVDGDIVYGKIRSKLLTQFVDKGELESIDRVQNDQGRDLLNLSKQIATQTLEFNKLTESNKLYERILGTSETDAPDKLSRLVMSSEIFQTEVGKYVTDDNNLIVNSMTMSTNTLVGNNNPNASVSVNDGVFTIKAQGLTGYNWTGFTLPIYVKKVYHGETYTLGFKYRIREYPDVSFAFNIKNHGLNKALTWANIGENRPPLNEWQEFQKTFTMQEDFLFGEDLNYPFYIYMVKNGWIEFKEPILVRGSSTGPYKPSQFDDAFAKTKELGSELTTKIGEVSDKTAEAKQLAVGAQARADQANGRSSFALEKAEDAQTKAIQVAEQARQAQQSAEATRTQVTQLAGSWSVKNLNSAGDVLGQLNLNPDGSVRINEGLLSVGEKTIIKDGVIKKSMIGEAQIGTAHISEIDASKAQLINVSAKNIVSDGLTANIIKGGRLSSLNGVTDFDLQTGWIDMNGSAVGIRNQFKDKPLQYLIFGEGAINGVPCAYTQLMSNRNGLTGIEHTSAGIQIWNGRYNGNVQTAITFYGGQMDFSSSSVAQGISLNTNTRNITNLNDIEATGNISTRGKMIANNVFLSGYGNHNLVALFNDIYTNIRKLHQVKSTKTPYNWSTLGPL